ncbi:MAG: protein translocase subunit SecD [Candidatus Andersenbacteria bacterium]
MKTRTRNRILGTVGLVATVALAAWVASPYHPSLTIGQFHRDLNVKLGLDLQGGSHLIYRARLNEDAIQEPAEALAGVRDVIERRVNAFGVSEPVIQTNQVGEEYRVIVELAGVHDPDEAIARIGETPQLDFRREIDNAETELNVDGENIIVPQLFEPTGLTGEHLDNAVVEFDPVSGIPTVSLNFDREGTGLFAELTRESLGKRIAIYLDGVPRSAPVVQAEITNGTAVISGGFTIEEANDLARSLNAGALPVPVELIGQQVVGPTLGQVSIDQSIRAGLYGLLAVVVWMVVYYRLPGLVAAVALAIYAVFFLTIIKLIPVTLTLAGIAGFILSIGMAVDANVLIFERFRENIRGGKTPSYALKEGFTEAWESIYASNVSSLFTAFILYAFGTSIIRGFAVTFALGILLSMFTAIVITRGMLTVVLSPKATHKPLLLGAKKGESA